MSYLEGNAYHEAGHAVVGWALDLHVDSITIREDRPGEHTMTADSQHLPLVDQVALCNAGRQSEEVFDRLLPSWASGGDREDTVKLLVAREIRDTQEMEKWIADGCARARELLTAHADEVHALAARLMECRHMKADEFRRLMENAKR